MAGSHEVRGSNPLFSTMNSIAGRIIGQRFFYFQVKGEESESCEDSGSFALCEGKWRLIGRSGLLGRNVHPILISLGANVPAGYCYQKVRPQSPIMAGIPSYPTGKRGTRRRLKSGNLMTWGFLVRDSSSSTASPRLGAFLLGYLGFRARISRLTCTLGRGTSFFMPRSRSGGSGSCPRCTLRRATRFFATVFLFVCSCCAAILLSRSSQSHALRDVALDCFSIGSPVARGRGVSAGDDPDGHGLVHV